MNWQLLAFFFITGVTLYSAYRVVVDETVTHAALYLAVAFVGVAGFFLLLGAEFLAAVQVLVYVGAVMTVMVFAIMLSTTGEVRGKSQPLTRRLLSSRWGVLPLAVASSMVLLVLRALNNTSLPVTAAAQKPPPSIEDLAEALLTTYLIPFEIASVLLLVAMVGAIILSKREGEG